MTRLLIILTITFFMSGCNSFLKVPATPTQKLTVSEELKYIYQTDQKDRRQNLLRFIFLSQNKIATNKKTMAVSDRDSLRLSRVMTFYSNGQIISAWDNYYAGFVFIHGGGAKMTADTTYMKISAELFEKTIQQTDNNKLKKRARTMKQEAESRLKWLKG